jgi:hypothetical protein
MTSQQHSILALLFVFSLISLNLSSLCSARTWRVPSEYSTLKAGCDSASYGDTVLVAPGAYERNTEPETWWLF